MISVGHRRKKIQVKLVKIGHLMNNIMDENNLLFIIKLTIKTSLQLISLKKKKLFSQSTFYKSFHFIGTRSF